MTVTGGHAKGAKAPWEVLRAELAGPGQRTGRHGGATMGVGSVREREWGKEEGRGAAGQGTSLASRARSSFSAAADACVRGGVGGGAVGSGQW